ncbi:hypothetical protein [Selenomonas sp. AE3005]|uniref:hypothetical protein n=1 Tax=Selenomonas sp. AE3005 TaxID=1485543 RepID=UPI000483A86E|nr:hypothetical protein [Selenomonas sp. AE3005]
MAYGYKIKKRHDKKAKVKTRNIEPRWLLASLAFAAGMLAPFGVGEAAIVEKGGNTINPEGKVYNISPENNGDFGYKRFEQFALESGYIAKFNFGSANVFANLVKEKISIDGIVNAVRDNKIDGHLIFLSPNGIAVGPNGVINAGQFTGIVPTQTAFDKLYKPDNPNINMEAISALNTYANDKTIDIKGHINTHSGVMLGAGIININDGAKIQSTKDLNFTDLVNIKNGDAISVNSGLTGLTASVGSGGDIILTAKQESAVKDTKTENDAPNPIRWKDRSTDLAATVNVGKNVSIASSDGAVKLTAESKSTYEDSTPMTLTDTLKGVVLGDDSELLNGLVDKLAAKEAGANKYLFVNYSSKKNKSAVNIGEGSNITGKNIDIAAKSNVKIKQSIAPAGNKDSEGNTVDGSKAVAAVAVSRVYNTADVVIDGSLTANEADTNGNGIKIDANADTKVELTANGSGGSGNAVAVGVAVLTGDTNAKVTVNEKANAAALTANNGKVSIGAVTGSDIGINAGAVGAQSYVVSNVGVANYDTSADVIINRSITAGAVDIKAENNITGLKMKVDNTIPNSGSSTGKKTAETSEADKKTDDDAAKAEKSKPDSEKSAAEIKSEQKSKEPTKVIKDASVDANDEKTKDAAGKDGKGGVKDVKDKVEGTNEGGDNAAKTSAFGLGASVGVFANKNDAHVTIGKNAVITAAKPENAATPDGSVNVSAKTLLNASAEKEDSLNLTVKNAQANSAKVEVGAAVLVSNVKNNANIVLDSDGDKSAQIKGGAVALDAAAGMGKYKKDDKDTTSVLSYAVSSEGKATEEKPATVVLDGSVGINTLKNNAIVLLGQQSKVEGTAVTLSTDAAANAQGTYGATEENSKVGVGATVGLQNISSNSLIMTGKGVELTGATVSTTANNSLDAKNEVKNAGKGDSIGVSGMVALSYGDSNSVVSLDDETKVNAPGAAIITAINATNVDNSARSETSGTAGSKAFGIGVGIVNYDVNSIAMVGDTGKGISAPSGSTTDAEKAAQKIYQDAALARNIAGDTLAGKLGNSTTGNAQGSIATGSLTVTAVTTGMLQNDAKAKATTSTAENAADEGGNAKKDSEKWTKWSKQGDEGAGEAKKNAQDIEKDNVNSKNESAAPTAAGAAKEASTAANPEETPQTGGAAPAANESAGASIGLEGSAALTFLGGRTDAVLNNVTVQNSESAAVESVALSATDFLGSITLGGTNIKHSLKENNSNTQVAIGGTFAMNSVSRDVDSILRNSTLQQVQSVSNSAAKTGIEVAAGMGVSTAKGSGTNVAGAGVVYYNKAKQDIHALLLNNTVTSAADGGTIANKAASTDFQIAGALAANSTSGAGTNVGVGGAVAISNLENNLSSGIIGGSYQNKFQLVNVEAQKGTTQINGAAAGSKSGYGFNGAFAYGSVKNTTSAYISGATVKGDTGNSVNVKAGEIPVQKTDTERTDEKQQIESNGKLDSQTKSLLKDAVDADKKNKDTLEEKGIDTTGEGYLQNGDEQSALDAEVKNTDEGKIADAAAQDESAAKDELGKNHSLTITAAMAGGLSSDVAAGAGIAYNYVKNDIAADIKDSTITADNVNGEAATDAKIISVGAGVAIGGKAFNGAGSGSWNDLKNDTKVNFANNTITGKNISQQAQNTSSIINIAGEVAGGKGMAMGLSLAYNSLNNTTGTYLTGNTVILDANGTDNSVKLATTNQSKALAVAGGVEVNTSQSVAGAVGTVAINRGVNNTESVIDGKTADGNTKLENLKELSVTAEELSKKTTVAGAVSIGGTKVGVGGAVAYTSVGSSSNKERLRAEINHADITTTNDGKIEVSAKDSKKNDQNELEKSRVITVGAGFGVGWGKNWFNLQGGAAVSDIYKDSTAALNNSDINAGSSSNHPTIDVTADTKSKINTVGVGGSVSIGSQVKGAAGVAINRMNQDTKAEMATDSGTTTVNAGLTQVRATGDGDIHSVGVGGLVGVGGQVAFAGSGSYNYIGNNVDAILKNQNLTSNSSVGVVAQSDDRLYNFAGGFAIGANTKVGLGAAVSINKITGSTNALVSGGSLTAADGEAIKVSRPSADKVFKAEKLTVETTRDQLSSSRTDVEKKGIVVDSSATHTIISQLSSGGAAISASVGVNVDGTVNINSIQGETADKPSSTTAKIQNTAINSAGNASDVNVNAVDYTNLGTFTGTPSIGGGGVGVSVGVSANWETLGRQTVAEISSNTTKKNVYAKNLTVDAIAKHGSSALSFAAAGSAGKVSVSSGDSIMRHKNTSVTSALLKNVNAEFDGQAKIQAEHLGNSHTENVSVSASVGMVAVAAGAGVSVMDDTSTVKAEVADSSLKAKESTEGKNISVAAKNENKWNNLLVTASLGAGIGAGVAANVGINNTTSETAALVTRSQLEAYDATVKAEDKLTVKATGGVGAGGVGGVGVAVALNNINSSVSAHVTGNSSVKAANDIDVTAEETRSFDSQVTGAAAGGIGVGVNVAVTSINKGITDAQLSSAKDESGNVTGVNATTQNEINKHLTSVNAAKGSLGAGAKFFGLKGTDSDLATARNTSVSLSTPDTKKMGIHTEVDGTTLLAGNNVNVLAKETSDIFAKNVGVTAAGAASVNVTDAIIHTNYDTDVTMNSANITGKNVNINAIQTQAQAQDGKQGSDVKVTAVTVGALGGVGVGYAGIVNKGATDVNIANSSITGTENVTVAATDESKHKSNILSVGVAAANVTTTFASVENKNNVGVTLAGTNNIAAGKDITIDAKRANTLEAHTQGVGVGGINVAVNHATIEDGEKDSSGKIIKGNAAAKITGTDGTFTANTFQLGAANDTTANISAGNTAVSVLGISTMRGKGVMDMGAEVSVAGGTFNANTAIFSSMLGNANSRTLEGNVKGHNISAGAVSPDTVRLETTANGKVDVANSTFGENTTLFLGNMSYVDRKAYIYDVTVGGVAVGNSRAIISGDETLTTTLTGKSGVTNKLNSLGVFSYGENKGKALADAGGGGLAGYIGSHVDNKSTNKVTSTLGGKWDVAGEVYLLAEQKDETKLTATEGHGGVIGVGGTSVENKINTTTNATVADNTVINADRVHIGTANAADTGAYDDTDSKGNKDVQTYTLKDHFGGAISGNRLRSLLDVTENGTVTIGSNAKITTNNLQEYIASSNNDLTNHASAKGGAAVGVVDAVTENNITVNNTVDVKGGAALSNEKAASAKDIILAAYDEHKVNSHADATVGGAVGVLVGKNETTMNRKSNVNVAGTIESGSNVGLYAGASEGGVLSNLNVDLKAGVYNYTAIPVSSPTVNYNSVADRGAVDVSGTVRSTKDINVIASGGKENVVTDESKWAWVNGGKEINKKFLSSDAVVAEEAMPKTSTVSVTGSLIAGTADPINLIIGGSVANGLTITAPDNRANNRVKNGVTQGNFDYANTLGARLAELKKLIAAYEGDATQMAAYIAERDRIQQKMRDLGLDNDSNRPVYYVEIPDIAASGGNINVQANDFNGTGKLHANSAPSVTITNESDAYLKINNIIMGEQGGQIVYNKDNVIPPGTTEGNKKINEINVSKSGARFSEIYGVTNGEAAGLKVLNTKTFSGDKTSTLSLTSRLAQEIDNSDLTDAEKTQYKKDIRDGKFTYTAITDVEVNGKISNFHGNVTINNASGDIRISGGTTDRPTGVFGNTVTLVAANGTIAQDYKEGIVNINGDPEKYLATKAAEMKNALGLSETNSDSKSSTETYSPSASSQTATGYIAGRDVYVSASNINVNGLIQSGYKNYTATVTETDLAKAQKMSADRAAVVQNRTMYKVNDGGAQWNQTDKVFDYVPQVYWDPSTKQLFVEDIDTAGGKVYLTGMIASTGQGKILAADGAAIISVTNQTALDMNVGNVLNNQREGVITIADTAKDTWTEYRKGQTRTIDHYAQYLKDHRNDGDLYASAAKTGNNLSVGNDLTYGVKKDQTYSWVNGVSVETTQTFEHYVRKGLWGAIETVNETQLKEMSKNKTPVEINDQKKLGLPEGAVIKQGSNNTPDSDKLQLDGSTRVLSSEIKERTHDEWRSGFLGWFKHTKDRWKTGTKTVQLYNYTLNASQPITIGLLGDEKGKIDIKSTNAAGGSINLTGNVANSHNQAALTIDSQAGGILQKDGTTLKSEIVNLSAKNDIKNIHIASIGSMDGSIATDNIKLTAVSNGKGDIDITATGGLLNNQSLPGNVEIVALKSQDGNVGFNKDAAIGDVTLNASGNITQFGSGITVEGRGINLTSKNGGIGTSAQAIQIAGSDLVYATDRYGAQVNASAHGDIYLTESAAGGDMRVGKIESKTGDVTLKVENGGFIDGLPSDDKSGSTEAVDDMVHRWIDAGLIDGEKDANGNYTYKGAYIEGLEKARDDYKANIEEVYDVNKGGKTQTQWQEEANAERTAYQSYLDNKAHYGSLSASALQDLEKNGDKDYLAFKLADKNYSQYRKKDNTSYETADEFLQANSAAYKYAQYENATKYLEADAAYKDLAAKAAPENRKFEWTKDMMLYAVSDKLVNKDSGSSIQTERAANVLGKNITLNAAKAVGTSSDTASTITVGQLTGDNKIDYMKQLMNAGASDVTAKKDAAGNLTAFEIKGNMPLGVKASGTLNVQAGGNVSVAGRKDENGEHSALKVGMVDATQNGATGDVRLHSELGIYNDLADANGTNIKGKNLILTGGQESIGSSDKPLTVYLSGDGDMTEVRADKNVFIKNMNTTDYLRLGAMFAKDTISLNSDKGFLMSNANGEIAQSYINAGKTLEFNTNANTGIVGNKDYAIRILNDRAPVNITAKSAYIKGVNNTDVPNGTLVLGTVNTKEEFVAASEGSLAVGREEEKDKAAVAGSVNAGGDVTLTAAENLTLDGAVTAVDSQSAKKDLTLTATNGSITQTSKGAITADKVKTFNGKSLLLDKAENKFNSITVDGTPTEAAEKPAIAGEVRIKDNADALTVEIKRDVAGDISVTNLRENGSLANVGNFTATGNITLAAKGTLSQTAGTIFKAGTGKNVTLTSTAADIKQAANAGIKAVNVNVTSAKTVDLQGTGNKFKSIAVQASQADAPIAGDVSVKTNTDDLEISVQPAVAGNIAVENRDANGSIEVLSALQANNNDATTANNGNIELTAGANVNIHRDITTGQKMPAPYNTFTVANILADKYNSLTIKAGGVIQEAEGVKIDAPVVDTQSGKGVSLESSKNKFAIFLADGKDGGNEIAGSVKAITNYEGTYVAGTRVDSIKGDADFTNLAEQGNVRFLADSADVLHVLGGNNAQAATGSLRLAAGKDVELLGNVYAKNDIVLASTGEGSIHGLGKGMEAGNDVFMLAKDAVYYIGTMKAGNSIDVEVWHAASASAGSGIHIGTVASMLEQSQGETLLEAGKDMNFIVKGNGDVDLEGKLEAKAGTVTVDISGQGDISIGQKDEVNEKTITAKGDVTIGTGQGDIAIVKGIESTNESIKLETGKGNITVGRDNVSDEKSLIANKNVSIGTNTGTITIQGHTVTTSGDISMKAGKDVYIKGAANGNFIIKEDGLIKSGGGINLYGRNGDIYITDKLSAEKGLTAAISEQGSVIFGTNVEVTGDVNITTENGIIAVGRTVNSEEGTVNLQTGKGDILIGKDITAGDAVTISSHDGAMIIGAASIVDDGNVDGDVLAKNGNVSIKTDKGSIDILKSVTAQKGEIDITTDSQGKIRVDDEVQAAKDIAITAKEGNIEVGNNVNSTEGSIRLQSEIGDVLVGKDVTAGKDVTISTHQGNVVVGDTNMGDAGDILAKAGNVSIQTDKGNIGIVKTVTAQEGSIDILSGQGDILIGNNGPDVKTVTAKQNIDLTAKDGKVVVYGKTSTEIGDISITAHREQYIPGEDNSSFIIDQNGKLEAGGAIHLNVGNGDLHVSDRIQAKQDLVTELEEKGGIYFDTDVNVAGKVSVKTTDGDIYVGHDVRATQDIVMAAAVGTINVGATVVSGNGNVNLAAENGDIAVGKEVRAEKGSIGVQVSTGNVTIGDNGPDVETVTAHENINIGVDVGKIYIYGKTSTQTGDISMAAGNSQYKPGELNFVIEQNGQIESGRDVLLNGRNGDLHVTDRINAKQGLNAKISSNGGIYLDNDVSVTKNVDVSTDKGNIIGGHSINSDVGSVRLLSGSGNILIGKDITAEKDIDISTKQGNVVAGANVATAAGNVNLAAGLGNITIGKEVRAEKGNIGVEVGTGNVTIGDNSPDVETVTARENINIDVDLGKIYIYGKTSTQTGDISMTAGNSQYKPGELSFVIEQNGQIESGRDVLLNGRNGDLHVTDRINAKRDLNAKIRSDGGIYFEKEAVVSGDSALAGNFIYVDGITANNGGKVFHFSMTGTDDNKLIGKEFYVGSLRSKGGTEMLSLWGNSGYLHVDEGNLSVADVLAVDKIYLDNAQTDLAIYGRTPTRDGEQLAYWNNLGLAYSKERSYQLYTDGMLRTHGTVLVDCGRYYTKLYGDNLSVVDMMRERDTNVHGKFTFDGTWLTRRVNAMKQMSIDMDAVNADFLQKNDVVEEVVVD